MEKTTSISRFTIDIPKELHHELKVFVAQKNISMREFIEKMIKEGLKRKQSN